jgi:hypothetical protein
VNVNFLFLLNHSWKLKIFCFYQKKFYITPLNNLLRGPTDHQIFYFAGSGFHRHHPKALSVETTNYSGLLLTWKFWQLKPNRFHPRLHRFLCRYTNIWPNQSRFAADHNLVTFWLLWPKPRKILSALHDIFAFGEWQSRCRLNITESTPL